MTTDAVRDAFAVSLDTCRTNEAELGRLDAVAGDGDHGSGMVRGFTAACASITGLEDAAASVETAGFAFADAAGGASGALWGAFIQTVGRALGEGAITASGWPLPCGAARPRSSESESHSAGTRRSSTPSAPSSTRSTAGSPRVRRCQSPGPERSSSPGKLRRRRLKWSRGGAGRLFSEIGAWEPSTPGALTPLRVGGGVARDRQGGG